MLFVTYVRLKMTNLAFILEDEPTDRFVLEERIKDIGMVPTTQSNLYDAKKHLEVTGDVYSAYFLDMQVPIWEGDSPTHKAGLALRDYLIRINVNPENIFLMSGIVSYQDERAAEEYGFPANQIVGKDQLTEKFLRELLKIQ